MLYCLYSEIPLRGVEEEDPGLWVFEAAEHLLVGVPVWLKLLNSLHLHLHSNLLYFDAVNYTKLY